MFRNIALNYVKSISVLFIIPPIIKYQLFSSYVYYPKNIFSLV